MGTAISTQKEAHIKRITWLWLTGLLLYGLDFAIKRLPHWRAPLSVATPIDALIPFEPAWVWIYLFGWWLFIFGGGAYYLWKVRHNSTRLRQGLLAVLVMQLGAWAIHLLLPTYMPRPLLSPDGSLSLELVRLIYTVDPPTHAFPSLHVASTFVIAYFLQYHIPHVRPLEKRLLRLTSWSALVLISLSTLFIKQHSVVDVLGGLLWGYIACRAGLRLGTQWLRSPPAHPRTRRVYP